MSSQYPSLSAKDVVKILKANGFIEGRKTGGSHQKIHHPVTKKQTQIPFHGGNKSLPIGMLKSIEKQSGVSLKVDDIK